jgi:nucleosome assembly protein 1-like 1
MDVPNSNHPVTSTPQNTPANAAPISSHAQKPGVNTIKEGKSQSRFACPSNPA